VVVRRVGVLSVGKVMGALYALIGLIAGAFFALFSVLGAAVGVANSQSSDAIVGLLFGVGSVIFLPIFYGVLGFIVGLITALLYNGVARIIGGIEIEVEQRDRVL
jgi:threonine/homoserine efflux transporter RhtA